MRSWKQYFFWMVATFCLHGLQRCDTERTVEDFDLHYFVKYYGGLGNQRGVDLEILSDGTFLLLGNSAIGEFDTKIFAVRVDSEGKVIWEKEFRGENYDIMTARDLEPTGDGNFIILYDFQKDLGNLTDTKLLKISPDGTPLDSSSVFGFVANDFTRSITRLNDGRFIVSGTTEFTGTWADQDNPDPDLGDMVTYRFDQNLDIDPQWGPVINGFGSHLDVAVKTFETTNGYYVFGYTNSQISGGLNDGTNPEEKLGLFYLELQSSGTPQAIYYPGNLVSTNDTEVNFVHAIPQELGAGLLVLGTSQTQTGRSDLEVARMRPPFSFQKTNDIPLHVSLPLGGSIRGVSATSATVFGTGYLLVGNEIRTSGAMNIWISKIDQRGELQWSSTFGSEAEEDYAAAVKELPDGKIVILGTMGLADNQFKMALIKVNPAGQLLK